jgi:hypothetical protein
MNVRWLKWATGVVALFGFSCNQSQVPGDEVMGTVQFHAEPYEWSCRTDAGEPSLAEQSTAPFDFQAILSHNRGTGEAFVTLNNFPRPALFDGQVLTSVQSATRFFAACEKCPHLLVEETIAVSLLSKSQSDLAQGACPPSPLDGGVALPDGGNGVTGPSTTAQGGFDMLRACGEVVNVVRAGPDAGENNEACTPCVGCSMKSTLTGTRQ